MAFFYGSENRMHALLRFDQTLLGLLHDLIDLGIIRDGWNQGNEAAGKGRG